MFSYSKHARNIHRIVLKMHRRNKSAIIVQDTVQDFESFFPKVLKKVSTRSFAFPEVLQNVKRVVEYSANEENKLRGTLALLAYKCLEKPEKITDESLNKMRSLAWGAEMVETYTKIIKDMEESPGNCCWHVHDPSLLRSFIHDILKDEITDGLRYAKIIQLFEKAFLTSTIGNILDSTSKYRNNLENFTTERYNAIVEYNTSLPTFKFPILLAKNFVENGNVKCSEQLENICSDLGKLYHLQMDYTDCYGKETDYRGIPNHSRHIQAGKCTWLAVTTLQTLTPTQKIVFSTCYGSTQPAHIERLKLLYDQMQMKTVCKEEQDKLYTSIATEAGNLDPVESKLVLNMLDVVKSKEPNMNNTNYKNASEFQCKILYT